IRRFDHGVGCKDPLPVCEYQLSYRTGDIVSPKLESHEPLAAELADFAAAIREGGLMPQHAARACDVVRITEAVDRSLLAGGESVEIPPARTRPSFTLSREAPAEKELVLRDPAF